MGSHFILYRDFHKGCLPKCSELAQGCFNGAFVKYSLEHLPVVQEDDLTHRGVLVYLGFLFSDIGMLWHEADQSPVLSPTPGIVVPLGFLVWSKGVLSSGIAVGSNRPSALYRVCKVSGLSLAGFSV